MLSKSLFPQSCVSSGGSMVGLMVTSSKRPHHSQVCCTQSPCPCARPLLTGTSAGDTQTLKGRLAQSLWGSPGGLPTSCLDFFPLPHGEDSPSFCIPANCPSLGNSLSFQWLGLFPTRVGGTSKRGFLKRKVPQRLELRSLDSKSRVLTITPWNHDQFLGSLFRC